MSSKTTDSLISVIITTFNRASVVGKAIKSVLLQTYQNIELLIIDDGSDDNTNEVIKEWMKKSNKIQFFRLSTNLGANAARNKGIQLANGKYIAFLDSDDEWLPRKLEKQIELFKKKKSQKLGMVYCGLMKKYPNGIISFKIEKKSGNVFQKLLVSNFIGGASIPLIKKNVFEVCGGFDESRIFQRGGSQDYDMWLRIASKFSIGVVPEILVYYNISKNSISLNSELSNPFNRVRARLVILKKFRSYFDQHHEACTSLLIAISPGMIRIGKRKLAKYYLKSALNFTPFSGALYFHLFLISFIKYDKLLLLLWNFPLKAKNLLLNLPNYFIYLMNLNSDK
ncbi:MAG: glycosyltransferase family 2 protein [Candidatus Lokiarchaeota archaeon]|nr:glycosyltransferase family 2 protein [Candidatus Harpocratesius repetitus]